MNTMPSAKVTPRLTTRFLPWRCSSRTRATRPTPTFRTPGYTRRWKRSAEATPLATPSGADRSGQRAEDRKEHAVVERRDSGEHHWLSHSTNPLRRNNSTRNSAAAGRSEPLHPMRIATVRARRATPHPRRTRLTTHRQAIGAVLVGRPNRSGSRFHPSHHHGLRTRSREAPRFRRSSKWVTANLDARLRAPTDRPRGLTTI